MLLLSIPFSVQLIIEASFFEMVYSPDFNIHYTTVLFGGEKQRRLNEISQYLTRGSISKCVIMRIITSVGFVHNSIKVTGQRRR